MTASTFSLAYCSANILLPDENCDEIVEYDDYELEEDEYEYLIEYGLISADCIKNSRFMLKKELPAISLQRILES